MLSTSTHVLKTLSERGYRITRARTEIVRALESAPNPLTIPELAALVSVDEASVYRTVDLLKTEDLLEEIVVAEEQRYALAAGHHHHIVCATCNIVVHVPCNDRRRTQVCHPVFTDIFDHTVTYIGTCKKCA